MAYCFMTGKKNVNKGTVRLPDNQSFQNLLHKPQFGFRLRYSGGDLILLGREDPEEGQNLN